MRSRSCAAVGLVFSLLLAACHLPLETAGPPTIPPEEAAGATVAALLLTQQASEPSPVPSATASDTPLPTVPPPTATLPSPTPAPTAGCTDLAQFVTDVTIPDGTVLGTGVSFTKTWRLKNAGTCTWTPDYALVFFTGDQMNAPAVIAFAATVAPGTTVDVSTKMTAPASNGTYRGDWKLRNSGGILFGVGSDGTASFWVKIKVGPTPTPTPTPHGLHLIILPTSFIPPTATP
jgi:hypothetical protein